MRVVVDFSKGLNLALERNPYPLPIINHLFDEIGPGNEFFSVLDVKSGFFSLPLAKESQDATTATTPFGQFKFLRLPQGISTASAHFQHFIDKVLSDFDGGSVAAYVDDVCLGSPDIESHKILLSKLFARLAEVGITVNWSKSPFFATRVPFLGHMVTKHGLETKEDKVRAVTGMPKPSTADELNSQLSMLRFYGRFVPNFSARAAPLRRLLRKGVPWVWGSVEESALLDLRKALTSAPVLCFPDMSLPFSLVCDASKDGFGALLYQTGKGGELCAV